MLTTMRKHAGSWMIKVLLFAIVIVFCFFGVSTFRNSQAPPVAEVNGQDISYDLYRNTFNNMVEQYRRAYQNNFSEEMVKTLGLRQKALDQLIYQRLTLQEASRLNLLVTEKELDQAIQKHPAFQVDGQFNAQYAKRLLSSNNYTTASFREGYRQELLSEKVQDMVFGGTTVSDEEVRQWYDWNNAQVNLAYVQFKPDSYKDVVPTDGEIKEQFETNKESYKTEPKVKVRYLFVDPKTLGDKISLTDAELEQYYQENIVEFQQEKTVSARHILFKMDADAADDLVESRRKEAEAVYQKAKQGEDFAELAKQYSEGPTKDKGGDLGSFTRNRMVKPFADRAFSMQAGDISEPVRTQFGWHLIKVEAVTEASTEAFESVKDTIRTKLITQKSRQQALEKADMLLNNVFDGDDLAVVGEANKIPVMTTEFFTRNKPPVEGIGNPQKFAQTAFDLEKMAISDVLDLNNGFFLIQVVEKEESVTPPFETVAEKVKADTIKQLQQKRAQADAQALVETLNQGTPFKDAIAAYGLEEAQTDFFNRNASISKIGYAPAITKIAFELTPEKPLAKEAVKGSQDWYVIRLLERKAPDVAGFESEKQGIADQLIVRKKQSAIKAWLDDLKKRGSVIIGPEYKAELN